MRFAADSHFALQFDILKPSNFRKKVVKLTKEEFDFQRRLIEQIEALNATVAAQAKTIEQLSQTIAELREQINKNSKNSSKPPSSDGLKKPAPKSLRESSGKKAGGQDGHQGSNLSKFAAVTEPVPHMPAACAGCPHYETCKGNACITERRQVVDINVEVKVTEHQTLKVEHCMLHGDCRIGTFPEDVKAAVQYGNNLQALVVTMNTMGAVSIKRTHEILSGVFGIPIATGSISNMVKRCASQLTNVVDMIKQYMIDAKLGHFDETGTRVDKKLWWVHDASNEEFTYLALSSKRGAIGIDECGVLPVFSGIAMHDCWASYWNYTEANHAVCCAHLLRELTGIFENHPDQQWASDFMKLLLKMKKTKEKLIAKGKECMSTYYKNKFSLQYQELIKQGKDANPLPETPKKKRGRKKKGKILALIERLEQYKASVCLFANDFSVPFDNNQAECDIRMVKVKTKVSGCFRTEDGARDYLKIMSYVGTAHKHGFNAYEAIKNAFSGTPEFIFG